MTRVDSQIAATVQRETSRLAAFIRQRVRDVGDAEDILQDVFFEFVRAYRLPEPIEQVSHWLYRVARNRIIDRYRKQRAQPVEVPLTSSDDAQDGERLDLELPSPDAGPEAQVARTALLNEVHRALDELPAEQREVFVAHEIEGLTFKEIAASGDVPINTLLARKRYAVLHLRSRLRALYDDLDK